MQATDISQEFKARLYWQCRRGMLELDSLLQNYYKLKIDSLNITEITAFESLLQCSDELLLEYLMGRTVPVDAGIATVVREIRQSFNP